MNALIVSKLFLNHSFLILVVEVNQNIGRLWHMVDSETRLHQIYVTSSQMI